MKLTAFLKLILGFLLFSSGGGALIASDVDELRERAKAMRTKAALLAEQGNKEQAQQIEKESIKLLEMAERLQAKSSDRREKEVGFGIDKETLHLKDRHRPEFRAQIEKLERVGQRMHHLRVAAEHLKLAEEHDLAHKLMTKAEDIERDVHAAKKRLAAEMHVDSEHNKADRPDLVAKLKEENERLRAELRELKHNAEKR